MTLQLDIMGILEPIQHILDPWVFLASSASCLPGVLFRILRNRQFSTLLSWSRFQEVWFAAFWKTTGPQVSSGCRNIVLPLLQGLVRDGSVLEDSRKEEATAPLSGTVLEIGPGSGMWLSVFGELVASTKSNSGSDATREVDATASTQRRSTHTASTIGVITKIYGVEPNTSVHGALKSNVAAAGLDGVYEIMPMGIEDLAKNGSIEKGSVDCVVCILCLCGIPEPQKNINELYGYLKPGGRIYAYEHVCCTRHWSIVWYQRFVNLFWPHMIGGCQLLRDTGSYLKAAGPWSSVDLAQPVHEPWYQVVPHVLGVFTK